jgi:hypothetical protein
MVSTGCRDAAQNIENMVLARRLNLRFINILPGKATKYW